MKSLFRPSIWTAVVGFALTTASFAQAQVQPYPQTLPPNVVVGRLGAGTSGPSQAIPFATLASQLAGHGSIIAGCSPTVIGDLATWSNTTGNGLCDPGTALTGGAGVTLALPTGSITLTFPGSTDTMVGRATTDTLSNKTLASPTITGALTATGLVTLADLATQATNTALVNATSGTASPTAQAMPSCSSTGKALIWTTNTGFGCATITTAASSITAGTTTVTGGPGVLSNATSGGVLVSSLTLPSGLTIPSPTISGALTYGGVTLSSAVTGTGAMALSAGPTFTGTITAAAENMSGNLAVNFNTAGLAAINAALRNGIQFQGQDGTLPAIIVNAAGTSALPFLAFGAARGTVASPTTLLSNDPLAAITFYGYTGAAYVEEVRFECFYLTNCTLNAPFEASNLSIASGKTLTASNTITLAGTDGTTWTGPASSATLAFVSGTLTSGHCLQASGTAGAVADSGAACGSSGSTPGGSSTDIQFNSSGAFGGDSHLTYAGAGGLLNLQPAANTAQPLLISAGSTTGSGTSKLGYSVTGTLNTTGNVDGAAFFANITNTASGAGTSLVDIQASSTSVFSLDTAGNLYSGSFSAGTYIQLDGPVGLINFFSGGARQAFIFVGGALQIDNTSGGNDIQLLTAGTSNVSLKPGGSTELNIASSGTLTLEGYTTAGVLVNNTSGVVSDDSSGTSCSGTPTSSFATDSHGIVTHC